ncbi:MAG: ZIP family metal transporter [archaeon]
MERAQKGCPCLVRVKLMHDVMIILCITILGPFIGSAIGVFLPMSKRRMYDFLAFAGGIMIAISFKLIMDAAITNTLYWVVPGVLCGALLMYIVDAVLPHVHPDVRASQECSTLKRTAVFLIIGIGIHNLPEGMAIALSQTSLFADALAVAIAIAVHDIPEGICTSAPYYHCTGKRAKAFWISSLTAVPTLLGFAFVYFFLHALSAQMLSFLLASTAGVMLYMAFDELVPSALAVHADTKRTTLAVLAGVVFVFVLGLF